MKTTKFVILLGVLLTIVACSKNDSNTMTVQGNVKGLKKGTIYLQKIQDTTLITLDSLLVSGDANFKFNVPIESPEAFYLYLNKEDHNDYNDRILFFGEAGTITINSTWDLFEFQSKISGSKSNDKLQEYKGIIAKFNNRNLDLIKNSFEAKKQNDSLSYDSIQKLTDKNQLRRYLFSLNFALNNKDSYVAPYIALSEVFDARVKYLDTINNALSDEVANSKYGKELKRYITKIKADAEKNKTSN